MNLSFRAFLEAKEVALPPPPANDRLLYLRQLDDALRAIAGVYWWQSRELRDYAQKRRPADPR